MNKRDIEKRVENILQNSENPNAKARENKKYYYAFIEKPVLHDFIHFDSYDRNIYSVMKTFTREDQWVSYPSQNTLSLLANVGKKKLVESIRKFQYLGLIKVHKQKGEDGRNDNNIYEFEEIPEEIIYAAKLCSSVAFHKADEESIKKLEEWKEEFKNEWKIALEQIKKNNTNPKIAEALSKKRKIIDIPEEKDALEELDEYINETNTNENDNEIEEFKMILKSLNSKQYELNEKQFAKFLLYKDKELFNETVLSYIKRISIGEIEVKAKIKENLIKAIIIYFKQFLQLPSEEEIIFIDDLLKEFSVGDVIKALKQSKKNEKKLTISSFKNYVLLAKEQNEKNGQFWVRKKAEEKGTFQPNKFYNKKDELQTERMKQNEEITNKNSFLRKRGQ